MPREETMSVLDMRSQSEERREGLVRAPQSLVGGLALMALAALALWLLRDLQTGTLSAMGSGLLPRALAVGLGLFGLGLTVSAFYRRGLPIEATGLRGPVFILLAIFGFALTIKPFSLGPVAMPGLGLVIAGPLAIVLAGFATPEARVRELVVLALGLIPCCMVMFGDLLNLPVPIFPSALLDSFPEGWSQKAMLRLVAGLMILAALILHLTGRNGRNLSNGGETN